VAPAWIKALELLEHQDAVVSNVTRRDSETEMLTIHAGTALVLLREGYTKTVEGRRIAITDKGRTRLGRLHETPAQRRQREAAEALEAQARGEWDPAPAGASAAASREEADRKRSWAEQANAVNAARDHVRFLREMLEWAEEDGMPERIKADYRSEIREAEDTVREEEAELERMRSEVG
jgi:hypothetical protein